MWKSSQPNTNKIVECIDLYGKIVSIPSERISFRPSAYGIILHEGKILLCNTRSTGKYSLPGGGVDLGETLEMALHREVFEECGIEISIDRFVHFEERFFYYNPSDKVWQVYAFVYLCKPTTFDLELHDKDELEAEKPHWVDVRRLNADAFQVFGDLVMSVISLK